MRRCACNFSHNLCQYTWRDAAFIKLIHAKIIKKKKNELPISPISHNHCDNLIIVSLLWLLQQPWSRIRTYNIYKTYIIDSGIFFLSYRNPLSWNFIISCNKLRFHDPNTTWKEMKDVYTYYDCKGIKLWVNQMLPIILEFQEWHGVPIILFTGWIWQLVCYQILQ